MSLAETDQPSTYRVYIGTFTRAGSKGLYLMQMDVASGKLTEPELVSEAPSPSFLALHPSHRFLYSDNEVEKLEGRNQGGVSAYSIDPASGHLTLLNRKSSGGTYPTHLVVDPQGKNVLVANYGTGSVAVFPIESDGRLGERSAFEQHTGTGADHQRQEGPHAHCINIDPSGRYAISCDLGVDKVFVYKFDSAKGSLAPNDPPFAAVPPGSGPRHLAFSPDGKRLYVVDELSCAISVFDYDADHGMLSPIQTISTQAEDFHGERSSAEVAVHPSGKFLYASNRGDANNLAIFSIDASSGKLTPAGHLSTQGRAPRDFAIDPTGTWLLAANQDTSNIVEFRIDPATGGLTPTGVEIKTPTPVCVLFVPLPRR